LHPIAQEGGVLSGEPARNFPRSKSADEFILHAFAKIDRTAFGIALGAVLGLVLLSLTVFALLKGSEATGLNLLLLSQYYPGYTVTLQGAFVALVYGFVSGFVLGWFVALLRNASLGLYLRFVQRRAELSNLGDFLDRF
jgi:hypothetical protein